MRFLVTAAAATAAAMVSAGAAQAVVVDLTYTVEAEVVSFDYNQPFEGLFGYESTPYPGPFVGDIETRTFSVMLDADESSEGLGARSSYRDFGPTDGSGFFSLAPLWDEFALFDLTEIGAGSIREVRVINPSTDAYASITSDVLSWSVDGLPELAPVPIPASLPLLLAGMGALAWIRRRA